MPPKSKWQDPEVAAALLSALIIRTNLTGEDFDNIAAEMTAKGHETGSDALR